MSFIRSHLITITLVGSLALAAASGFFAASALGLIAASSPPTTTTTISLATGETGPQGPPGPPGPGITMKGTVATPADLPQAGNTKGDTYIVSSDGSMQVWDGSKWVSGGPIGGSGGGDNCPSGSQFEGVVIDHPGGHVTIWTCVAS